MLVRASPKLEAHRRRLRISNRANLPAVHELSGGVNEGTAMFAGALVLSIITAAVMTTMTVCPAVSHLAWAIG